MKIPFNKPYISGKEFEYIAEALRNGHISGNGDFTKKCHQWFSNLFPNSKLLLTTSCTDALEMAAILMDIQAGDEIIMPAYTFVSTANAFLLRGAKIVFVDSHSTHPGMDESKIETAITSKTKAIVPVHYAGVACDMDIIMSLAKKYNLLVCEDAAQGIDSFYKNKPLGSFGDFAAFSFHETKNISSGEGGLLVVNNNKFASRAEIIWEKGTNRSAFFRGEVDKYNWVDIGSSFLPSEMIAAFLFAQLENINRIQEKRNQIWTYYFNQLSQINGNHFFSLPQIPDYATNNAHMFYIVMKNGELRDSLIQHLRSSNIHAVFHYLSLNNSPYYATASNKINTQYSDMYSDCLVRLPLYYELEEEDQSRVVFEIRNWVETKKKSLIENNAI